MRPDDRELDEEIRGHLAINIKERIDRGEDPEAARLAAMREFGYLPHVREQMRQVWYSRWFDLAEALAQDIRVGMRSLWRAKGLAATVVITLALGIGANAAIFSVVRGVLLRPLVNRGEDRLIYIQQSAPGIGVAQHHLLRSGNQRHQEPGRRPSRTLANSPPLNSTSWASAIPALSNPVWSTAATSRSSACAHNSDGSSNRLTMARMRRAWRC